MSAYPWHQEQLDTLISGRFQSILLVSAPGQSVIDLRFSLIQIDVRDSIGLWSVPKLSMACTELAELEAGQQNHPDVIELQPRARPGA